MLVTGDLIFVRPKFDPTSALDNAILATGAATIEWLRAHGVVIESNETVVHVAMAWRNETSNDLFFVEAAPPVVTLTPADLFFDSWTNSSTFYRGRLRSPLDRARGGRAADYALTQRGKPYADDFGPPPRQYYCSSLVDWAYRKATGNEHVFVDDTFQLIFVPLDFWQQYYSSMNQSLPVNVTGTNPTLLLHSPHVEFSREALIHAERRRAVGANGDGAVRWKSQSQ